MSINCIRCGTNQRNGPDLLCDECRQIRKSEFAAAVVQQTRPNQVEGPDITDLVTKDLELRRDFGIKKYGTPLRAHNGRNPLIDAYQEALDLCLYLRQCIAEQESKQDLGGSND